MPPKNSSNQLVLIPKTTPTTSADTVPLSVQFEANTSSSKTTGSATKCKSYLSISSKYQNLVDEYNITYRSSYIRSSTEMHCMCNYL